ncbi:hypothetical protein U9M48_020116 [Paspalum notatum var. saurae]|uniref:Reverse transcriptase zinc-binding domain-containing protein n=1 Tax=Paspalum notatum var. saurae TaxID=547442 RepID=A0AAQ3WS97_PASNO
MARNMKLLLCAFEHLSGLKINFTKSELYCFGKAHQHLDSYMEIFGCKVGEFPFNYLGIPIHYKKLRNADWKKGEERFEKRLRSWKGKYLSIGGRLTLINSVLSSLPMYMMSFFDASKGVLRKLEYFRSRFFWQGDDQKKKYRLARRSILSQPKDQGGLGIHELGTKNIALLSKWLYKLLTSNGTWQQLILEWRSGDSHFWSGLLKAKRDFLRFGSFMVRDGVQVRFWKDIWLGPTPLRAQYPCLYNIARPKNTTIAEVLSSSPPNLSWRRDLVGPKLVAWNHLLPRIANFELSQEPDDFHWNLTQNGVFSVKSLYQALIRVEVPNLNKKIWKNRAPLKVKIFLWYLRKGVLLTKDNLAKRKWQANKSCVFCHNVETIDHLFFECRFARIVWSVFHYASNPAKPINAFHLFGSWIQDLPSNWEHIALLGATALCWSLWLGKNDLVFEKKDCSSPWQVIFAKVHWVRSWAILQRTDLQLQNLVMEMEASQHLARLVGFVFLEQKPDDLSSSECL